jgi:L-seryl-tRNA(Ser) seleniumtransferase
LLKRITGCEDALVVNNNAAAVLLMLTALCRGREVIISRGQLVEIGGGFRVPDVMAQSGARLVEVGTTNRTHLRDYEQVISDLTGAILVAHHSNFQIVGFTAEPEVTELAQLAHAHDLPLLFDQGSGALLDTRQFGLAAEPLVGDALAAGVDVIAFSGDKLLGGSQAGILCGKAALLGPIKRHPLARAVRADKSCLAALNATLLHYLKQEAVREIPVWRMIARSPADIQAEASQWAAQLQTFGIAASVIPGESTVGGGSVPGSRLPTFLLAIDAPQTDELAARLRAWNPPIIGRIAQNILLLDPRTVLTGQGEIVVEALVDLLAPGDRLFGAGMETT